MGSLWMCLPMLVLLTFWHSVFDIPFDFWHSFWDSSLNWWFPFLRSSYHRKVSVIITILNIYHHYMNNRTSFCKNYTYYLIQSASLVIMDKHLERLATICRLCRLKAKTNNGYYTRKFIQDYWMEIFEIFNYDLGNDSVNIHSSHVCDPCPQKLEHYKKSDKKTLVIDIAPFDSHSEQCFCSTPECLSKFKFSWSLSKISKEIGSSNSKQLEGALDEITTKFVLASARNLGYFALELSGGEIMLIRMKFESNGIVSIELTIKVFPDFYWQIYMFSKEFSASKPYLEHLPPWLTVENIEMFLKHMKDA